MATELLLKKITIDNFFGFGQSAEIDIIVNEADKRTMVEMREDGKREKFLLYYDGESISGKVNITLKKPGVKMEHNGITIDFIGHIELYYDRGGHHEFLVLSKQLSQSGELFQNTSYDFDFANVEKPFESYFGTNVKLRYFLRVTLSKRLTDLIKEMDIAVHALSIYNEADNPIKMEVGIEDSLHIEFEYNKSKYHLKDTIVGKIYFLLVRIKIRHMELAIIKKETSGSGPNTYVDSETVAKYEIMDGAPVKGESIPIRLFLSGYDFLTPTMRDIYKKFSVRYFLNLVLIDEEDRRYFKQQEIVLWRKGEKKRRFNNNYQVPSEPNSLPTSLHSSSCNGDGDDASTPNTNSANENAKSPNQEDHADEDGDDDEDDSLDNNSH